MPRLLAPLALFLALGACGADGPPLRPGQTTETPADGVHFSGTAQFGVTSGS